MSAYREPATAMSSSITSFELGESSVVMSVWIRLSISVASV
jgi:hypothetical protein